MEEVSSLESFDNADTAAVSGTLQMEAIQNEPEAEQFEETNEHSSHTPITVPDEDGTVEQEANKSIIDDEFEQISDGTFEGEDDSQNASVELPQIEEQQSQETNVDDTLHDSVDDLIEEDDGTANATAEAEAEAVAAETDETIFEEVDAQVSANANSTLGDETDALGLHDNTLPIENDEQPGSNDNTKENATEATDEPMEVDDRPAQVNEEQTVTEDVEMASLSNSPVEKQQEGALTTEANKTAENDEQMENMQTDEATEETPTGNENDNAIGKDEEGTDVLDTTAFAPSIELVEEDEDADPDADKTDTVTETNAEEEDNAEHGDEPIEHVVEPEESDVCLVPDDTENEVTDAEKEQAILARENAEKEAETEQTAAHATTKSNEIDNDNDASEAEPTSADDAAAKASETDLETTDKGNSDETQDPDEPLLEEMPTSSENASKIIIGWIVSCKQRCIQCGVTKTCGYRLKNPDNSSEIEYICDQACCDAILSVFPGKYFVRRKKFLIEELSGDEATNTHACLQCKETRPCKYFFRQDVDSYYICNDNCYNVLNTEEPDKFKLKRHSIRVRNIGATTVNNSKETAPVGDTRVVSRTAAEADAARLERLASFTRRCADCSEEITLGDKNLLWETLDFCNEICLGKYQRSIGANCQTCNGEVPHQALGKYCVRFGFDIRQFCCASCLNEFKKGLKSCSCCQKDISSGTEGFLAPVGDKEQFKDFCSQACMRRYDNMCNPKKKLRTDTCAVCKNDKTVRVEILLDNEEHIFCSNPCFSAFKFVGNIVADQCGMCSKYFERKGLESFTIYTERRAKVFCSRICFNVYIIANRRIVSCQWCKVKKYNFDMIYKQQDAQEILMCSLNCLTLYGVSITAFSRTVAKCDNCTNSATPQYHLTMSDASMRNFCTYQCVMQFQSQFARTPLTLESEPASQAANSQQTQANSKATTSAASATRGSGSAPYPTGIPKRVKLKVNQTPIQTKMTPTKNAVANKKASNSNITNSQTDSNKKKTAANTSSLPIISTVSSLASGETETMIGNVTVRRGRGRGRKAESPTPASQANVSSLSALGSTTAGRGRSRRLIDYAQRSPSPPTSLSPPRSVNANNSKRSSVATAATSSASNEQLHAETKIIAVPAYPPLVRNVAINVQPQQKTFGCQTDIETRDTATQTGKDYSNKVLIPVPVPIYIPQPMYMYSAPFPVPVPIPLPIPVPIFVPTTRNSAQGILKEIKKIQDKMPADPFEAELLMMAEMVAEEKRESDSDSDDEIKPDPAVMSMNYNNNVHQDENNYQEDVLQMAIKMATGEYDQPGTEDLETAMTTNTITNPPPGMVDDGMLSAHHMQQGFEQRPTRGRKRGNSAAVMGGRASRSPVKRQRLTEIESTTQVPASLTPQPLQPVEKPDANLCLKYTFGVNAWKQWVVTKNADIEKSNARRRTFKTDLLQMTADELNYSLCLFVKEVRKPNGTEYAPDTIYYLVLGIQQYLYENGRIDNIFTDPYYERFTDCLDEVARKFSVLYNDSQYIVTRVEEEHLWECKQLGAHSPHVLLSTLMFFNTKHFNLTTVEEHMQLSFSHIMKHWKRTPPSAKNNSTRNVLLRFYPPQAGIDANPRKKKVYEQQENEENPLRCPVRLYEFYLSKCPESVKTRNDVFYLQPERSCVPDSPVWYSTQALSQESLQKMLHRVKMVKEINIALLTS